MDTEQLVKEAPQRLGLLGGQSRGMGGDEPFSCTGLLSGGEGVVTGTDVLFVLMVTSCRLSRLLC